MNKFESIDTKFTELDLELKAYAKELEFEIISEFNLENYYDKIPWIDIEGK